jgi:rhodanese-related sulfurtransferase
MPTTTLTVTDARAAQGAGATLIDVRSSAEFSQGHPAEALNVPLLETDEDSGHLMPNPDFVRVMKANFAADARLLVSCQTGGRSGRATQILAAFGFTELANVAGGYQAWKPAGLPVDSTPQAGRTYAELLAAADAAED